MNKKAAEFGLLVVLSYIKSEENPVDQPLRSVVDSAVFCPFPFPLPLPLNLLCS